MVNDKSTLDGSLVELSEVMVTNLTRKHVDNIRVQDGLTTLAGKILQTKSRRIVIWTSAGNDVDPETEYIPGSPGEFYVYVLVLGENEESVVNHTVDLSVGFLRDLSNDEISEIMADMGGVIDSNVDNRTFDLISCTTNQYGFATFRWKSFAHGNFILDASSTVEGRFLQETYEVHDIEPWVVTDNVELDTALSNCIRDDIILIRSGEYSISKTYDVPCVTIQGDEDNIPNINVGNNNYIRTNDTESGVNIFENIGFRGQTGGIYSLSPYASVEIRNCNWKNMVNTYNYHGIMIDTFNDDKYILIEDCEFINNYTTGYGHFCTNIDCIAPDGARNLIVRNCIFNATRDNATANLLHDSNYRVAMNRKTQWSNPLQTEPAINCYFCNNQYLHQDDTLYGFESDECP